MSTKPTKHSHIFTLLSTCHQEPPWQRQEGTSGGSPIESGKTALYVVKASLSNSCACSSEGSFSKLSWHADNKKAEPELSPQDKKGQRTAVITGFISVAFGVSVTTAMAPTTMPEGAICCSTVQWSPCCTYCCNVTAAQAWLFGDLISTFFVLMLADHTQSGCSIEEVLHYIDNSIQYGEDADVKIRDFENEDADEPDE